MTAVRRLDTEPRQATPSIGFFPYISNKLSMARDPLGMLRRTAVIARQHGDVAKLSLITPTYIPTHPDFAAEMLMHRREEFVKPLYYDRIIPLLGANIATKEGEEWMFRKKLLTPEFSTSKLNGYAEMMAADAEQVVQRWKRLEDGTVVDVYDATRSYALRVIFRTMCGIDIGEDAGIIQDAYLTAVDITNKRLNRPYFFPNAPLPENRRFDAAMKILHDMTRKIIARSRSGDIADNNNFLCSLIATADDDQNGMTDESVFHEVLGMIFGGHDTTANIMAWMVAMMGRFPDQADILHEEASAYGSPTMTAALSELPATLQFFWETARLHPPVWAFIRSPVRDTIIGGHMFPKGSTIMLSPYLFQRDERFWDQPEQFIPGRFANGEKEASRHPLANLGFSGGARVCLGRKFAYLEGCTFGAQIAKHFRFEPVEPNENIELLPGVTPEVEMTMRPKGGLKMRLFHR